MLFEVKKSQQTENQLLLRFVWQLMEIFIKIKMGVKNVRSAPV